MKKLSEKQFRHLVSAMLHIGREVRDKDEVFRELMDAYSRQPPDTDPVVWLRNRFKKATPYPEDIYIRRTFTARTYQEVNLI